MTALADFLLARIEEDRRRMLAEHEAKCDLVIGLDGSVLFAKHNPTLPTLAREWLEMLAVPYADHADYRPEWRP